MTAYDDLLAALARGDVWETGPLGEDRRVRSGKLDIVPRPATAYDASRGLVLDADLLEIGVPAHPDAYLIAHEQGGVITPIVMIHAPCPNGQQHWWFGRVEGHPWHALNADKAMRLFGETVAAAQFARYRVGPCGTVEGQHRVDPLWRLR